MTKIEAEKPIQATFPSITFKTGGLMSARIVAALVSTFVCVGANAASAQSVVKPIDRPDPATISLPDMAVALTKSDAHRFDEYFYFHKVGVSYERAFTDLDQCRINSTMAQLISFSPRYVPLGGEAVHPQGPDTWSMFIPMWGLGGAILANFMIANATDDNAIATNRKCMAYKGYNRFGTSRVIYKQIESGSDVEKLARRAKIASGPSPQSEVLEP